MSAPPPSERVATIARNVRALRQARKWSTQTLSDRMTDAGYPIQRSVLSNLEIGYRRSVTVDELFAFADLFGVSVEQMVTPLCETCQGSPPAGFICGSCNAAAMAGSGQADTP